MMFLHGGSTGAGHHLLEAAPTIVVGLVVLLLFLVGVHLGLQYFTG